MQQTLTTFTNIDRDIYKRNWNLYNTAQTSEKLLSLRILNDAVDSLQIPYYYNMRSSEVTPYLHRLYMTLATPLSGIEEIFATDATGFSTTKKHWVEYRMRHREWRMFKKLHAITGVRSTIITRMVGK